MGFVFKTENERNPVETGPTPEEILIKGLETQLAETQAEIAKLNEFLELVGRGHLYDLWKDGLYDPKLETILDEYVDFEDLSNDDIASLENEK